MLLFLLLISLNSGFGQVVFLFCCKDFVSFLFIESVEKIPMILYASTLHGYVRLATYPVSDMYLIQIRTGYAVDTYP
jgi:hypothetical protein